MMNSTDLNTALKTKFPEKQMAAIAQVIFELATSTAVRAEIPSLSQHVSSFIEAVGKYDPDLCEYALANLYSQLHCAGARYSPAEMEILKTKNGYSCISGGLSPLIKAAPFIKSESTVADIGAGNGLQGLLLQRLYPHKKTMQIEISFEMIRIGRIYQQALEIISERIEWINDDLTNVSITEADFIYIYRPARPSESGLEIYQNIARKLISTKKSVVIFSVADCLAKFLDKHFSIFYTDGHLTCFSNDKPEKCN